MSITHIIFDLDGVLTDGRQNIDLDGTKQFKTVNCRDKTAIKRMIEAGYKVVILTMDDWPGAVRWFEQMGCDVICTREKEKANLPWESCAGIGDDVTDIGFLAKCQISFCPQDAHPALFGIVDHVFDEIGGCGIASLVEWFLLSNVSNAGIDHINYILQNGPTN